MGHGYLLVPAFAGGSGSVRALGQGVGHRPDHPGKLHRIEFIERPPRSGCHSLARSWLVEAELAAQYERGGSQIVQLIRLSCSAWTRPLVQLVGELIAELAKRSLEAIGNGRFDRRFVRFGCLVDRERAACVRLRQGAANADPHRRRVELVAISPLLVVLWCSSR